MPPTLPRSIAVLFAYAFVTSACESAIARVPPPIPDAEVPETSVTDAGFVDASVHDAAVRDAARDTGVHDASLPEPALTVPDDALDAALKCPEIFRGNFDPVLLVHGTGANADLGWDWSYTPALTSFGYDVCTIDLPSASWEDIPTASEYVVRAVRTIASRASRKVALIGHSQGTLEIRWALRYWPSLRAHVSDIIGLAGVDHGTAQAQSICSIGICRVATWQMRPGSAFLTALDEDEMPRGITYTSIYSTTDTTAVAPTSVLERANNIALQTVCPGRKVSHAAMISDAVTFALVVATLESADPVQASWIDPAFCERDRLEAITTNAANGQETRGTAFFLATYLGGPQPSAEPALPAYAIAP